LAKASPSKGVSAAKRASPLVTSSLRFMLAAFPRRELSNEVSTERRRRSNLLTIDTTPAKVRSPVLPVQPDASIHDELMEVKPVVIEYGSYSMKAGFGGDTTPSCITRTVVGRPQTAEGKRYVGEEVWDISELHPHFPVHRGTVVDWDEMIAVCTIHTSPITCPRLTLENRKDVATLFCGARSAFL